MKTENASYQYTMNIFGSKRGHFWSISQLANSLVSWPILKISEYFYVEMVYFYFKKCNRNHFWTILKKKIFQIFSNFFFALKFFFKLKFHAAKLWRTRKNTVRPSLEVVFGSYILDFAKKSCSFLLFSTLGTVVYWWSGFCINVFCRISKFH